MKTSSNISAKSKSRIVIASVFLMTAFSVVAIANYQPILSFLTQADSSLVESTPLAPINNAVITQIIGRPKIELVFVLDTTGSMSGLIKAAKEKIWSIASTMAAAKPTPEISIGIVAYRDRGDDYITRKIELSSDLDSVYAALLDLDAAGGGDDPESVNAALNEAVNSMQWSQNTNSYKVIFLVGDAPGHDDYADDVAYPISVAAAAKRGIIVNTIQAGNDSATTKAWRTIAQLGSGDTFQVEQQGSAIAIATPFDDAIVAASQNMDKTRLFYGDQKQKALQQNKQAATDKLYALSSSTSLARRAKFNLSDSGKENFAGPGELIESLANKSIALEKIEIEQLPAEMQIMSISSREDYVLAKTAERENASQVLAALNEKRDQFIKQELDASGELKESLDEQLISTLKAQAEKKGLDYSDVETSY